MRLLPAIAVVLAALGSGCGTTTPPTREPTREPAREPARESARESTYDRSAIWDVDTTLVAAGPAEEAGTPAIPDAGSEGEPSEDGPDDGGAPIEEDMGPKGEGDQGITPDGGTISTGSESKSLGEAPEGGYAIQIFATRSMAEAETIQARAAARLGYAARILAEDVWKKVRLGPFATRIDAERALARARDAGYDGAWITAWGPDEEER